MADLQIIESNSQFMAIGAFVSRHRAGADILDQDGLAVRWAGAPDSFFNTVVLAERITNSSVLKRRFHTAAEYMRSKPQRGFFLACQDYISGDARTQLDTIIDETGLVPVIDIFGMMGDYNQFNQAAQHVGLRFERAIDEAALRQCADLSSMANDQPPEVMRESVLGAPLWMEHAFSYLGYYEGKAVSTATVIESEGQLHLVLVATHPEMQRRGFSEATIRHALKAAHEATGVSRVSLHSKTAARTVYERIGYKQVTCIPVYALRDTP